MRGRHLGVSTNERAPAAQHERRREHPAQAEAGGGRRERAPRGLGLEHHLPATLRAQAIGQLDALTQGQAVMSATDQMFLITSVVFVVAAAVVWLAPKPTAPVPMGGGGH